MPPRQPDRARRPGAPARSARAATFSFYPAKNLGCFGDGGAITTSVAEIAERCRVLRFHGSLDKRTHEQIGYNSRLDELQAAVLRVQLPHLDEWADGRRRVAGEYEQAGLGALATPPSPTPGSAPAWHLYVLRHADVARLRAALQDRGIGCRSYYTLPTHRQPAMRAWGERARLPATDELARTNLAVPMSPCLSPAQVAEVVAAARAA